MERCRVKVMKQGLKSSSGSSKQRRQQPPRAWEEGESSIDDCPRFTMEKIPYVVTAGSQAMNCPASNLYREDGKKRRTCWSTTKTREVLYIKLAEKALVSYLRIENKHTSCIEVHTAMHHGTHSYLPIRSPLPLPHDKGTSIAMGHLPCRYIRITCLSGAPISFYSLTVRGLHDAAVRFTMGTTFERLVCKTPQRLLFGHSFRAIQGPFARPYTEHTILIEDDDDGGGRRSGGSRRSGGGRGEEADDEVDIDELLFGGSERGGAGQRHSGGGGGGAALASESTAGGFDHHHHRSTSMVDSA